MSKVRTWRNAFEDMLAWNDRFPGKAHTLTLSNHHIGPRRFEFRLCVRDAQGRILVGTNGFRSTRYLSGDIENFILEYLCFALDLHPGHCRNSGEPTTAVPTYPLFDNDPLDWETEPNPSTFPADVLAVKHQHDSERANNQIVSRSKSHQVVGHTLTVSNHQLEENNYEIRICMRDKKGEIFFATQSPASLVPFPRDKLHLLEMNLTKFLGIKPSEFRLVEGLSPSSPTFPLLADDPPSWRTELADGSFASMTSSQSHTRRVN